MKCPNCGAEVPANDSAFCANCGAELGTGIGYGSARSQAAPLWQESPRPAASAGGSRAKRSVPLAPVIAMGAVIVILVAVIVALALNGRGSSGDSSPNGASQKAADSTHVMVVYSSSSPNASSSAPESESASSAATAPSQAAPPETDGNDQAANTGAEPSKPTHQGIPPFWGVWIGASKDRAEAQSIADGAASRGLPVAVVMTTDFENLNPEPWWVVSVGYSDTESKAEALLDQAVAAGYADAYIKYTGALR